MSTGDTVRAWEWRKQGKREFDKLSIPMQAKLWEIILRYCRDEQRPNEVKKMPGPQALWEVRAQVDNSWPRILFTKEGTRCIGLTAFKKQSNKTEQTDLDRAVRRI